jgi:hypothetical protein
MCRGAVKGKGGERREKRGIQFSLGAKRNAAGKSAEFTG